MLTENQLKKYIEYLRSEEKSKATIEKYQRDITKFLTYATDKPISKELVMQFKEFLSKKYKVSSVNSILVAVNLFLDFIKKDNCKVKLYKVQRRVLGFEEKELTREEYNKILAISKVKNEKLFYLIQTICCTGIRVSELEFITVESLNRRKVSINNKGKTREIVIPNKLNEALKRYCQKKHLKKGTIFITKNNKPLNRSNIWRMMKSLCKEAKVDQNKVFPHNLRHLFSLTYYRIEKDIVRLADILGHSSIETTRIYTTTCNYDYQKTFNKMNLLLML